MKWLFHSQDIPSCQAEHPTHNNGHHMLAPCSGCQQAHLVVPIMQGGVEHVLHDLHNELQNSLSRSRRGRSEVAFASIVANIHCQTKGIRSKDVKSSLPRDCPKKYLWTHALTSALLRVQWPQTP
jgi:hypothetical protein